MSVTPAMRTGCGCTRCSRETGACLSTGASLMSPGMCGLWWKWSGWARSRWWWTTLPRRRRRRLQPRHGDAYQLGDRECVSTATVRTSLPAQPPTPVPTAVPTAMPVPVAQAFAAAETAPTATPMPTATAEPQTVEPFAPVTQASAGDDGTGGIGRIILAAIGVPMLIGALIVILLMRRERQRRNGYHGQSM